MDSHGLGPVFGGGRSRHTYGHLQGEESESYQMRDFGDSEAITTDTKYNNQNAHAQYNVQSDDLVPRRVSRKPVPTAAYFQIPEQPSSDTKGPITHIQPRSRKIWSIWWGEALCCVLAICAVIAMVVTVYSFKGKPLPQWPYQISISSLLAVYGLIFRASGAYILSEGIGHLKWTRFQKPHLLHDLYIYDEASRGPMGCLQMLSGFRGGQLIAQLGALLTLTLLIIDPFTQQLVKFESCSPPAPELINGLPRTSAYFGHGTLIWTGGTKEEYGMQAAVNAGVFTVNGTQVMPNCLTGNCTYGIFHTVGYCHDCVDVSNQLTYRRNRQCATPGYSGISYNDNTTCDIVDVPLSSRFNMSITSVSLLNMRAGFDKNTEGENARFTFMMPSIESSVNNSRAIQCGLEVCVRKVNASVVLGSLREEVLATYNNWGRTMGSDNATESMIDLSCLNDAEKQILTSAGYSFSPSDTFVSFNGSLLANGTIGPGKRVIVNAKNQIEFESYEKSIDESLRKLPARCIYTVASPFRKGMQAYLGELFTGNVTNEAIDSSTTGSSVLSNLYWKNTTLQGFNGAMSDIANSMTSYMRQSSPGEVGVPVRGIAQITTTCVTPQIKWIAYIATIALLVLIFFIAMICQTELGHDTWRHDFKNSALAMICAGLDPQTHSQLHAVLQNGRKHDLTGVTKDIPVRFVKEEGKFIRQD